MKNQINPKQIDNDTIKQGQVDSSYTPQVQSPPLDKTSRDNWQNEGGRAPFNSQSGDMGPTENKGLKNQPLNQEKQPHLSGDVSAGVGGAKKQDSTFQPGQKQTKY